MPRNLYIVKQLQIKAGIILLFLFICCSGIAKEYTVDNIPKVHLQDKTRYVCDPENILSAQACAAMDSVLYALEQTTGIETVVAVLPSIGNEDCFDFAHKLFNKWGVGKKGTDNGLVILLVTDQRCIQFETGYGLEGDLPDAICKRIQTNYMVPYLKNGDWDNGMVAGVRAVYERLNGSMTNEGTEEEGEIPYVLIFALLGFILTGIIGAVLAVRKANKCPVCKKHALQRSNSRLISRGNGVKKEEVTYTCRNCGHKLTRIVTTYDDNYHNGGKGGPFIGGFGGGFGSGGGGFSGGSFGGGMSGGGGSGSRF